MLIYFWVVLVISPAGFLEDLLGCSAIRIISDSYHIVNISKCMCSQNKVIHSFIDIRGISKKVKALRFIRGVVD